MTTTDKLPAIDGRQPIILEAIGGGFCIAAGDIAAHLYKDGKWKLDSVGANDSADEWAWPSRESAEQFLRSLAAPPVVKERLTSADPPGWYECYELPYRRLGSVVHWDGKWLHRDNIGLYGLEMLNYTNFRGPLVPQNGGGE